MENIKTLDICIPSLISLKIHGRKDKYDLVLDVPNVKHFEYHGRKSRGFTTRDGFQSLVKASVSFPTWSYAGFEALQKLFSIVSHMQHLQFCSSTLEAFQRLGRALPTFHNLTFLEMRVFESYDFDLGLLLVNVLDGTPHLDVLVLDKRCSSELEPNDLVPEYVPLCVATHLNMIEFRGFSMFVHEWMLVKYFLKNAKFLHTLLIQFKGSLEKQYEIRKKLLSFPRCSKACQIYLDSMVEEENDSVFF